jgi:glycosyltransferase involved in cell wall biosynthesis
MPSKRTDAVQGMARPQLLTVITPAYNEGENLLALHRRLEQVLASHEQDWEWIVVDDHSADNTFDIVNNLSQADSRVRVIRFARNYGSHTAIACGLHHALGDCAVVMAADLQDPPETLPQLLSAWKLGAKVVWAVRNKRKGESTGTLTFSRLYYFLMRRVVGLKDMPASGADFLLVDRQVIDAFSKFNESNVSIFALITWMGFRQSFITYDKQARVRGKSKWSLEKKLKLVADSVTSFTYLPIRFMSTAGSIVVVLGALYATFLGISALRGSTPHGWSYLMVVALILSGAQMMMMGVLGEYVWRAFDESRHRPRYLIEAAAGRTSTLPRQDAETQDIVSPGIASARSDR